MNVEEIVDVNVLYTELGITDFTYIKVSQQMDRLELYRSRLIDRIMKLEKESKDGENLDK